MALQKQSLNINFSQGLETKTDPFQVPAGKFLTLQNSIFDRGGLLQKRNGYRLLSTLPNSNANFVTTFDDNLIAIGTEIDAYVSSFGTWVNKGAFKSVGLETMPLVRSSTNQTWADSATSSLGLTCTVYTEQNPSVAYKYVITDSVTGQNITAPAPIPVTTGTVTGSPKVFVLGTYFILVFTNLITATNHLQYVAIPIQHSDQPGLNVSLSTQYTPATSVNFDGVVANNSLYLAWNGSDVGGAIRMTKLDYTLVQSNTVTFPTRVATVMSVSADTSGSLPIVYASFYDSASNDGYTLAVNSNLLTILSPTQTITGEDVSNIASEAESGSCTILYEVVNAYGYDAALPTNYIKKRSITQGGSLNSATIVARSVGLASEAFMMNGELYALAIYKSDFQPSYFLLNADGSVMAKLAYSNGPKAYYTTGIPSVQIDDQMVSIPYLTALRIEAVNKSQDAPNAAGVYNQIGVNQAFFNFANEVSGAAEIGSNLNIPGGYLMAYDGYQTTENGFFLWPDDVEVTTSGTGGSITAQEYFYVATYEWADNQGNIFRSAPSIPVSITTTGATSSNTINIPTLRLTYKIANPVKIVIYRWSTAQQIYYQVTSIASPLLNDLTVDYVSFVDTQADSSILGNNILYTTGGVLENIAPPASTVLTLFNNRLFMIDAEDRNLLWYSKQVIQSTPVEMSDLLTLYVAPSTSASGSTGPIRALAPLDDKLIIFKKDAIYYINGIGPDNTGANSQYSDAVFITSTVGCDNQRSIVFMPQGLMFQSDKGIWLLGRDLSTSYIGAPVQAFTQNAEVQSAVNVPGTNQVRFTMDSGITLMYDYYYGQWGTFTNVPAVTSTLYQSLHTYISDQGQVFQESPGQYLDGSNPVTMSFTTSWLNLAGVQGFERFYFFYILATYLSPHKLQVQIAYDYNPSPSQTTVITPDNFTPNWGGETVWGGGTAWGGNDGIEQWRVFPKQQKCESFQLTITEFYDPSMGVAAGAGLTISGLNVIVGTKSGYPRIKPTKSVG